MPTETPDMYRAILWECPRCGGVITDIDRHAAGHRKHDAEHDGKANDGDGS
jgi:hypothetical protein